EQERQEVERANADLAKEQSRLAARDGALGEAQKDGAARQEAIMREEARLEGWEERLRVNAERLERESTGQGQASQDAFALLAELERREAELAQREADQGRGEGVGGARVAELDSREALRSARDAEPN